MKIRIQQLSPNEVSPCETQNNCQVCKRVRMIRTPHGFKSSCLHSCPEYFCCRSSKCCVPIKRKFQLDH